MIVDDEIFRIGSANMNNRSGADSECDVFVDCTREGNEHARSDCENHYSYWPSIAGWTKKFPSC